MPGLIVKSKHQARVRYDQGGYGDWADTDEYRVPEKALGALIWSLYQAQDVLPQFERYRVLECDGTRDILVCTHGTVDAACAKFGFPLYRYMGDSFSMEHLLIWWVSHFGAHVFAPTFIDMPTGHCWAFVEEVQAEQIIQRHGDASALRGYYRGWAGVADPFLQVLERDPWQAHGWDWFTYAKAGEIVTREASDDPQWAEARMRYKAPCGASQVKDSLVDPSAEAKE